MQVEVNINEEKIKNKVKNDKFGKTVSLEWKRLIDPYTPRDTGNLMQRVDIEPFRIHYKMPYAEEVYYNREGKVFITQGSGRNPYATAQWDKAAESAGKKTNLYSALNNYLKR